MNVAKNEELKFSKICSEWLSYKKPRVKESTYLNYNFNINKHLNRHFKNRDLKYFTNYDFNKYVEYLQYNLSNKTARDIITILKSILKYTERKYDIDYKLDLISLPKVNTKEIEIFEEKERKRLEKYIIASKDIKMNGILISLYSGLRIGEICALKWSDLDFENKLIQVTHTLQRVYVGRRESKIIYTTPKTKNSVRKIPMAKILLEKLKDVSTNYSKNAFILTGKEEKYLEPTAYRYSYSKAIRESKIMYRKYHCLRHTFATRCVRIGMDVKSLSEILGHSSVSVTLGIYVHSSYEVKKKFIDKL